MRKTWIVARHEFLVTTRRVWFLVAAFFLPVFFAAVGGVMTLVARGVEREASEARAMDLGLLDRWGGLTLPPRGFRIVRLADEEEGRARLRERKIGSFLVVPPDYLKTGSVRVVTMRRPTLLTAQRPLLPASLEGWLVENVLRELDPDRVERAKTPLLLQRVYLDPSGQVSDEDPEAAVRRSLTAYAFFLLLLTAIFTSSAYLLQGLAEEKEHRVMEMVLSSVTPEALMAGKLLGLGAAGLLQVTIWAALGVVGVLAFAVQLALDPQAFLLCLVYFLLGYLLFGSLMLGFGALGSNLRESQQMASVWTFLGACPAFILIALIESPQGTVARVFSFIPFTAPTTMMFRATVDPKGTPALDIVLSLLLLAASTALALWGSARLFRAGLLLYGKKPGLREIWRWLVAAR